LRKRAFIILLFSAIINGTALSQSVNLPIDHWAYDFLERMEVRGIITRYHNSSLPLTRREISRFVKTIDRRLERGEIDLSRVEMKYFERIKGELCDELSSDKEIGIKDIEKEPHFYTWEDNSVRVHLDALLGGEMWLRSGSIESSQRRKLQPYYGAIIRGEICGVGFYSDNRIFAEWGSGKYQKNYNLSQGYPHNATEDGRMATWDTSESYLTVGWRRFGLQFGRDNVRWGPSMSGLILSGLSPSFDLLRLSVDLGRARFTWFCGELRSSYSHKWISAHRLEVSLTDFLDFGISESVIYGKRGIELAYCNPLIPFLIAEHTLGDRDNVNIGIDFEVNRIGTLKLYGELLIDDMRSPWDLFSNYWGNKLAFTLGGLWVDCLKMTDTDLRFEYTRIDPFVYTHEDSVNVYENYNLPLGHFMQPNSEGYFFRLDHRFDIFFSTSLKLSHIRHGEGDRRKPHDEGYGESKKFLSGAVESTTNVGMGIYFEMMRDLWLYMEISRVWISNKDNILHNQCCFYEAFIKLSINW